MVLGPQCGKAMLRCGQDISRIDLRRALCGMPHECLHLVQRMLGMPQEGLGIASRIQLHPGAPPAEKLPDFLGGCPWKDSAVLGGMAATDEVLCLDPRWQMEQQWRAATSACTHLVPREDQGDGALWSLDNPQRLKKIVDSAGRLL